MAVKSNAQSDTSKHGWQWKHGAHFSFGSLWLYSDMDWTTTWCWKGTRLFGQIFCHYHQTWR